MDLATATAWATVLLILPGSLVTIAAGLRGFMAVAFAPGVSTTIIAGTALVTGFVGGAWTIGPSLVVALIVAVVAFLVIRAARRWGVVPTSTRPDLVTEATSWVALAGSALLSIRLLKNALGRPDAFSQTFDNIFHMSAVRYIVETDRASSLLIGAVNNKGGGPTSFYPAAFHDVASLVLRMGPPDISVAINGTVVALAAIVWPMSCLALVRLLVPATSATPATLLGAGVLTASFGTFPLLLIDFGVLYPNMHAFALVPGLFGLLAVALGLTPGSSVGRFPAAGIGLASLPGLALAHPNALMVLVAMSFALVATATFRAVRKAWSEGRTRLAVLPLGLTMLFAVGSIIAWQQIRPPEVAATWGPIQSAPQALGEALLNATPGGGRAAWLVGALLAAGIVVSWTRRLGWLVGSWATIVALWVVVSAFGQTPLRTALTGIWYNDPYRFSASLPLVALPLAVLGVHGAVQAVSTRLERLRVAPGLAQAVTAILTVTLLAAGTQWGGYMAEAVRKTNGVYALTKDSPLVTSDEYALIQRVPGEVPQGAVVATNPWNGSSMLYALTGIQTTTTHVLYTPTPDQSTIRQGLDDLATWPQACAAARNLGVTHVLDFGTQEVHGGSNAYPGLLDMARTKGFREVDRQGQAVLYELTQCRR